MKQSYLIQLKVHTHIYKLNTQGNTYIVSSIPIMKFVLKLYLVYMYIYYWFDYEVLHQIFLLIQLFISYILITINYVIIFSHRVYLFISYDKKWEKTMT